LLPLLRVTITGLLWGAQLGGILQTPTKKHLMKKLDLGGIKTAATSTRATHPVVEIADKETLELLEQFVVINPQFKTLKNQSETLSKQLGPRIRALYFTRFAGVTPESSTMIAVAGGKSIKLTTKNAYTTKLLEETAIIHVIGAEMTAKYFRQATVLKLDLEKCPEDKQEAFATGVLELAKTLGVTDAVSATQCIQPVAGFHESRTSILTAEQNIAVDMVLPVTAYPQL
jgi:hypothetical protein